MIRRNFLKTLTGALVAPFAPCPPTPLEQHVMSAAIGTGKTALATLDFEQVICELMSIQMARDLDNLIMFGRMPSTEELATIQLASHKDDEHYLWWRIRNKPEDTPAFTVMDELRNIIPFNRSRYLLEKWHKRGLWDYGVNIFFGWLTPEGEKTYARDILVMAFAAKHSPDTVQP